MMETFKLCVMCHFDRLAAAAAQSVHTGDRKNVVTAGMGKARTQRVLTLSAIQLNGFTFHRKQVSRRNTVDQDTVIVNIRSRRQRTGKVDGQGKMIAGHHRRDIIKPFNIQKQKSARKTEVFLQQAMPFITVSRVGQQGILTAETGR